MIVQSNRNSIANVRNRFQGNAKRVLCVCSAGLLRSPTIARVLTETYGYNTRAAGLEHEYALIPVSGALLEWADEIVTAEGWMKEEILKADKFALVQNLELPDRYDYYNPELVALIKERYKPEQQVIVEQETGNAEQE